MKKLTTLLALFLVLALGAAACSSNETETDTAQRDDSGDITDGGQTGVFTVQAGDCWNDPTANDTEGVGTLATVACSEPHDNQVVGLYDVTNASYPGADAMAQQANEGCVERYGDKLADDQFVWALYPSPGSWGAGDREVICSAFNIDGSKMTGDLLG